MLTKMTEEDWVLVLAVFDACRSRRGDKGGMTASPELAEGLEALHYFMVHNITWRALPAEFGFLEQHLEARLALEPQRRVRNFLRDRGDGYFEPRDIEVGAPADDDLVVSAPRGVI
ncbi:MAG: hypothetical protein M3178_03265 [Pseudomonadota bacterium]|nr:hypothetical protein [Pseudomonadota bacterium]